MSIHQPCKLCTQRPAIPGSHVLPAFVAREIKADSPTGFLRNPHNPNRRRQDSETASLLCKDCEQRFSIGEREFAANIFQPFHRDDQDTFRYGPWLHYFMTSLAWRILVLELPRFRADDTISASIATDLEDALSTMSTYLLGAQGLAGSIRNHAVVRTSVGDCSPQLAAIGPNVRIRRSAFGSTVVDKRLGHTAVLHNLAGFICVLIIKGSPHDIWSNTKVSPGGGEIRQPQHVHSWIMDDLFETLIFMDKKFAEISENQKSKVDRAVRANPGAPAFRFHERDRQIRARQLS